MFRKNKFIETVYGLQNIKRFANRNVIVNHSPAEHCYYVAILGVYIALHENLRLPDQEKYNLDKVMMKALCHDVPEAITGDILFPIKHSSEELHNKIMEIEEMATKEHFLKYLNKELQECFYEYITKCKDGREGGLVALCDQLEVLFYLTEERKLGNMSPWIDEVFQKVQQLVAEMSKDVATGRRLYENITEEFEKYNLRKSEPQGTPVES